MTCVDSEWMGCEIHVSSKAEDVKLPSSVCVLPTLPTSVNKGSHPSIVSIAQAQQEAGRPMKRTY